ncbi:4'-phosphopantetheinyl transferase family protein [Bartonella queenslandensis]|uniref:4'-phosphopantetheinyl transferase family protein n=1 Tax=Bartonella queenslandensis TaxID=481138 RepID=UPI001BA61172|nr:4'-phosphopantetheinyl transferase superfamily protein [Bartonella queenslandensis]
MHKIQIWYSPLAKIDQQLYLRYLALLSPCEHKRFRQFKAKSAQNEYLVGRVLLRTILSKMAPIAPQEWQFISNKYGRPEITPTQKWAVLGLNFNISHSCGLVVLAISNDCCIGIDVEAITRPINAKELAYRCFTSTEANFICDVNGKKRLERFYTIWILKEAYSKALGLGLSLPFDSFSFDLSETQHNIIKLTSQHPSSALWRFARWKIKSNHQIALAILPQHSSFKIKFFKSLPLITQKEDLKPKLLTKWPPD